MTTMTQTELDRRYRRRQATRGIVRKTVLVPAHRVEELHALMAAWRTEHKHTISQPPE